MIYAIAVTLDVSMTGFHTQKNYTNVKYGILGFAKRLKDWGCQVGILLFV